MYRLLHMRGGVDTDWFESLIHSTVRVLFWLCCCSLWTGVVPLAYLNHKQVLSVSWSPVCVRESILREYMFQFPRGNLPKGLIKSSVCLSICVCMFPSNVKAGSDAHAQAFISSYPLVVVAWWLYSRKVKHVNTLEICFCSSLTLDVFLLCHDVQLCPESTKEEPKEITFYWYDWSSRECVPSSVTLLSLPCFGSLSATGSL